MFNRGNLLIVALALASALGGLLLSLWLRPHAAAPVSARVPAAATLTLGDVREDLSLPDRDGVTRRLSEWDGKLILLNFWASWCGPCREEMPLLDRTRAKYATRGLEIIGIAAEDAAAALDYLRDNAVSYPILVNAPGTGIDVSLRYGNAQSVLPYNVLIGRDGRLVARKIGNFDERGLEAWLAPHFDD